MFSELRKKEVTITCCFKKTGEKEEAAKQIQKLLAVLKLISATPFVCRFQLMEINIEFSYSTNRTDFEILGGTVSGDILSTDVAGGFTGCLLGLYATSANDAVPE